MSEPTKRTSNTGGTRRKRISDETTELELILNYEKPEGTFDNAPDLICFSHLRWSFVYQRPQHLMSRCARESRVFYFEEPLYDRARSSAALNLNMTPSGVCVAVPMLPAGLEPEKVGATLTELVDRMMAECGVRDCIHWYYTPMALAFSRHLKPLLVVYDCMDELSGFRGAPPEIQQREAELLARADVVFTGGMSLYEAKAQQHKNIHPFPSSIDVAHFVQARQAVEAPADTCKIPRPRLGYTGVIDERMDLGLLKELAEQRPDWNVVMVGPVVKLSESELPHRPNIHYLGSKPYELLPRYLAGFDVAIMPFAHNTSTRYISPTKTPEYLAAGRRVVSTSIRDVARSYGNLGLVSLADTAPEFISAIEKILSAPSVPQSWLNRVDEFLAANSWDSTWEAMMRKLHAALEAREAESAARHSSLESPTWQTEPLVGRNNG